MPVRPSKSYGFNELQGFWTFEKALGDTRDADEFAS